MYRTIIREDYDLAIWDNCSAELQVSPMRARIIADVARWKGDTCSCRIETRYISLDDANKIAAAYDAAKTEMQSDDPRGHTPLDVLVNGLLSNYSPDDLPAPYTTR